MRFIRRCSAYLPEASAIEHIRTHAQQLLEFGRPGPQFAERFDLRGVVTGALEIERAQKRIGSSLEAHPIVHVSNAELFEAVVDIDLAEVCITSAATLVQDEGVLNTVSEK